MMLMHLSNVSLYHSDGAKLLHAGELTLSRGERWLVDGSHGVSRRDALELARVALDEAGLSRMAELRPHALNARMRRLAQLARLDAVLPDLILLDEPLEGFGTIDQHFVRTRIERWCADGQRCLVVSNLRGGELGVELRRLTLLDGSLRPEAPS